MQLSPATYGILADLTVVVHAGFVLFVAVGQVLIVVVGCVCGAGCVVWVSELCTLPPSY